MKCAKCGCLESSVVDSRAVSGGLIVRRRRACESCGVRVTTYEVPSGVLSGALFVLEGMVRLRNGLLRAATATPPAARGRSRASAFNASVTEARMERLIDAIGQGRLFEDGPEEERAGGAGEDSAADVDPGAMEDTEPDAALCAAGTG